MAGERFVTAAVTAVNGLTFLSRGEREETINALGTFAASFGPDPAFLKCGRAAGDHC